MASRKWLLAAACAAALAGCASDPYYYDQPYYSSRYSYNDYYYPRSGYWYGPGYYYGPSVSFGLAYSDRGYWRHYPGG